MQKPIKAVIFDLDNTILDRTRMFSDFTHSFLGHYFNHLESTKPVYDRMMELDLDGYKDRNVLFAELIAELPWREKLTHADLADYYKREFIKHAILMDQATDVLSHIRKNYRSGLITNGRNAVQYGKLDQLGIRDAFEFILVSEEAGVKKPDVRIFQMAINKLQVPAEECIYVGDHPINDIEGASMAGMRTIWIRGKHSWKDDLKAKPLHTIDQLSELIELL
ncbi:HAD family hydrolase [Paenibacillus sp. CF384]|uniref:HAD family hydrolase n=1 Tax=Paenibacillus sp. CF384 TaxID=1884382 RepID=UPI00089B05C4|nr:HAD family hydrolase [Paenibacillus sp. CF384]SDW23810.1 putative hydrolase of the HAD superfamily [Paenibacillus sp. CF384]